MKKLRKKLLWANTYCLLDTSSGASQSIRQALLYLEKEGEPLVVETEGDSNIKVGDTVKVGFSASRCHLFDSSQQAFK